MTYIIGPDVSFYQDDNETLRGIDFVQMRTVTPFVIIRAGQNTWVDPDFKYNYSQAKLAGLRRGSYWFYDSRNTPENQAQLWFTALDGDLGELPLFADFEEEYNGPYRGFENWKKFLTHLRMLVGSKEIAIYTAYYYWEENVPISERGYFKQYPLWIANYGTTTPLVPDPWGENEWLLWQYTDKGPGIKYGVESTNIDLNYFNGDLSVFDAKYPPTTPTLPEPPVADLKWDTHNGVVLHEIRRFDTDCFIHVMDLSKVRLKLTLGFSTVPNAVINNTSQLGFNGGGWGLWPNVSEPNEYLIIDGVVKQTKSFDGRPSMEVTRDNEIVFRTTQPSFTKSWNVFGFDRLLATGGVYNTKITNPYANPRTVYGKAGDKLVVLVCEGRASNQKGLTFKEVWSVMQEFGVTDCGNADGGYSSAAVNTSFDPALLNKTYLSENRRVVHQVLFYADGGITPPPGDVMKKYKVLIAVRPRSQPTMTTNDTSPNVAVGTEFDSDTIVEDTITLNGPQMVKVETGPYLGKWLPLVYDGKEYVKEVGEVTPPAPETKPDFLTAHYPDGTSGKYVKVG